MHEVGRSHGETGSQSVCVGGASGVMVLFENNSSRQNYSTSLRALAPSSAVWLNALKQNRTCISSCHHLNMAMRPQYQQEGLGDTQNT